MEKWELRSLCDTKAPKTIHVILFQAYPEYLITYQIVRPEAVPEEAEAAKASG